MQFLTKDHFGLSFFEFFGYNSNMEYKTADLIPQFRATLMQAVANGKATETQIDQVIGYLIERMPATIKGSNYGASIQEWIKDNNQRDLYFAALTNAGVAR